MGAMTNRDTNSKATDWKALTATLANALRRALLALNYKTKAREAYVQAMAALAAYDAAMK